MESVLILLLVASATISDAGAVAGGRPLHEMEVRFGASLIVMAQFEALAGGAVSHVAGARLAGDASL